MYFEGVFVREIAKKRPKKKVTLEPALIGPLLQEKNSLIFFRLNFDPDNPHRVEMARGANFEPL